MPPSPRQYREHNETAGLIVEAIATDLEKNWGVRLTAWDDVKLFELLDGWRNLVVDQLVAAQERAA